MIDYKELTLGNEIELLRKIDHKELRIGNYVYARYLEKDNYHIEIVEVDSIACDEITHSACGINGSENCDVYAIPITTEWLLRFGFTKEHDGLFCIYDTQYVKLFIDNYLSEWHEISDFDPKFPTYVHSLQNLHYALTDKELTCELS
tara:strand:- start:1937 stop:2377 length:441 start_codon:yes stop_codon:yes gene_type:complete